MGRTGSNRIGLNCIAPTHQKRVCGLKGSDRGCCRRRRRRYRVAATRRENQEEEVAVGSRSGRVRSQEETDRQQRSRSRRERETSAGVWCVLGVDAGLRAERVGGASRVGCETV